MAVHSKARSTSPRPDGPLRGLARRPRRWGVIVAATVVALSASACSQPVGAGVVVGTVTVSETTIQQQAGQVLAQHTDPTSLGTPGELQVSRAVATTAIRHQLAQIAAKQNGITVDEAQVSQTLASIGTNLAGVATELQVPQEDVDDYIRDLAVLQDMLSTAPGGAVDVQDPKVTVDYVTADTRDDAVTMRARFIANPSTMDDSIATAPTDPTTGQATAVKGGSASLVANPGLAATGLFAASAGDILLIPSSGEKVLVVRVTGRAVATTKVTSQTLPTDSPSNIVAVLSLLLEPYAASAGVTVNPRFGQWDQVSMQVVPGDFGA